MADSFRTDTPLPPGKVPNQWTASGTSTVYPDMRPKGSVWLYDEAAPAHTYYRQGTPKPSDAVVAPPPPPPPVEPPATDVQGALYGTMGDAVMQNAYLTVGLNRDGGIGSRQNAPEGYRHDAPAGYRRVGLYDGKGEIAILGRAVEGFGLRYGGKTLANLSLAGFSQVPGANAEPGLWRGSTPDGLTVEQRVTLTADGLRFDVTLTNTGTTAIRDLVYFRAFDPDTAASFATTSTATANGWASKLGDGRVVSLSSPSGYPAIDTRDPSLFKPATTTLARVAVGKEYRGDHVVIVAVAVGTLEPGASASVVVELGVR